MTKTQTNTSKLGAAVLFVTVCHLAAILDDFGLGGLLDVKQFGK